MNQVDPSGHCSFDLGAVGEFFSKFKFWEKPAAMEEQRPLLPHTYSMEPIQTDTYPIESSQSEESGLFLFTSSEPAPEPEPKKSQYIYRGEAKFPDYKQSIAVIRDNDGKILVIRNRFFTHDKQYIHKGTTYDIEVISVEQLEKSLGPAAQKPLRNTLFTGDPSNPYTEELRQAISAYERGPDYDKVYLMGAFAGVTTMVGMLTLLNLYLSFASDHN